MFEVWLQQLLNKIGKNDDAAAMNTTLFAGQQDIYNHIGAISSSKPVKGSAFTLIFPIYDTSNELITGAAGLDSEISKDGGGFEDCDNEASEIGASGIYTLTLTETEMTADYIAIMVQTTSGDAINPIILIYTVT